MTVFFWLLVAHAVCDYPLQGDFLSRAKHHRQPIPGVPFYHALGAHALIHGGAVALVTGSVILGLAETVVHAWIDYHKCDGAFGEGARAFTIDQAIHVGCKLVWAVSVALAAYLVTP